MTPNFQKLSALYFLPAAILAEVSAHAASLWAHNISAILDGTAMDDVERVALSVPYDTALEVNQIAGPVGTLPG